MVSPLIVGMIALNGAQLSYGTYLGRGWVIAAVTGIVTAVGLNAAAWISYRGHRPAAFPLMIAWLVLTLVSTSAIRIPFPQGPYGNVMAFFNVAHAAMLGFDAVTCTAILALMAYAFLRHQSAARRGEVRTGLAPDRDGDPDRFG